MNRLMQAGQQFQFLFYELQLIVNERWWRWLTCWFGGSTGIIVSYRLDRAGYLLFGTTWAVGRLLCYPIFLGLRLMSASHEIHYRANIGPGLKILHPTLGVVINGSATIGKHLTLTGGNCIGLRKMKPTKDFVLGDRVTLGVNAVVLGPVCLGDDINIGAGAVVVNDCEGQAVLVGVPARVTTTL